MANNLVLVADGERNSLDLIASALASEPLVLDLEIDGLKAWERLCSADETYALVLLDARLPGLDGLSFLRRMRADTRFGETPVIILTSAYSQEKVNEGLKAGAYYYLLKPFQPEALIPIVRGALEDYHGLRMIRDFSGQGGAPVKLPVSAEYHFRTLKDIRRLVPVLAGFAPQPRLAAPGLADLMLNAIEHGNLGITYYEKAQLKLEGKWESEIERRLGMAPFRARFATAKVKRFPGRVEYTIADQGKGFDWRDYLEFDSSRVFDPNGRGIALARKTSFSDLKFLGPGNVVVATVPA
ncbi:MAG: hypothetical protein BWY57_02277 [Betaproteobacteria bacterium ADurb.Bin341]|nr:MAG: hypothetical protein BWY57_02277 [Betaproteobacteria bacterium ADurb.Bin341]